VIRNRTFIEALAGGSYPAFEPDWVPCHEPLFPVLEFRSSVSTSTNAIELTVIGPICECQFVAIAVANELRAATDAGGVW
jgi:hypothetical protein